MYRQLTFSVCATSCCRGLVLAILLAAMWGCQQTSGAPAPLITRLYPAESIAGEKFQVQAGGISAIAIGGSNFTPGAKVLFDGRPLDSAFGNPTVVSATIPDELIARPGQIKIRVENPDGKVSNTLSFKIRAR